MKIDIKESENKNLVILSGELVGVDSHKLSTALEQFKTSNYDEIIVDLSDVKYMDSNCFGSLIYAQIVLNKSNKKIVLSAPKDVIKRIFRDCTFDQIFEIAESQE
jgi:anti-anti-sigma factor